MHWCGKLLADEDLLWIKLAKEGILHSLDSGPGCRTQWLLMAAEGLLLDNTMVVGSPLLRDLAGGLYVSRNSLVFDLEGATLPARLTIE